MKKEIVRIKCKTCGGWKTEWKDGECVKCYREKHNYKEKMSRRVIKPMCPPQHREMLQRIINRESSMVEEGERRGYTKQRVSYIFTHYTEEIKE